MFLYIRSDKKAWKEASMETTFSIKFAAELQNLVTGLSKPRGTQTLEKVAERLGKIKQKYTFVHKFYDTENIEKDGIVSSIIYQNKKKRNKIEQRYLLYKNLSKRAYGKGYLALLYYANRDRIYLKSAKNQFCHPTCTPPN
jgi:ribosomal protein S24E